MFCVRCQLSLQNIEDLLQELGINGTLEAGAADDTGPVQCSYRRSEYAGTWPDGRLGPGSWLSLQAQSGSKPNLDWTFQSHLRRHVPLRKRSPIPWQLNFYIAAEGYAGWAVHRQRREDPKRSLKAHIL